MRLSVREAATRPQDLEYVYGNNWYYLTGAEPELFTDEVIVKYGVRFPATAWYYLAVNRPGTIENFGHMFPDNVWITICAHGYTKLNPDLLIKYGDKFDSDCWERLAINKPDLFTEEVIEKFSDKFTEEVWDKLDPIYKLLYK
jgi:hypothetical protein